MSNFKQIFFVLTVLVLGSISALSAQKAYKPVVLYLKNLPVERIGTDSDEDIISDLKAANFFVLEVDCSSFPTTSPALEDAILAYYATTCDILKSSDSDTLDVDEWNVYLVPEGYRIKTNIPVWNFKEHGADGSVDYIMKTYNEDIVPKYKTAYNLVTVTDPDGMRDRNGNPINYDLKMDIVYPSGNPTNKVPLILDHGTVSPRPIPFSPCNSGEQLSTAIYPIGFLTSGYAWSIIDHCYNPLARKEVWDNISRFTLDNWNGLASSTAFVRYVKSHLNEYNLNGKIGSMGLSKASYSALRLSNKNNANEAEYSLFNGTTNTKTQPWLGVESTIDVAYIAAGHGTRRMSQYADENSVPIVTSAGINDQFDKWNEFPPVIKYLQNADLNYLALWMEDMGHNYPSQGTDLATGKNRYSLLKGFFDNYLKPETTGSLEVYYVFPRLNASEVDNKGNSRILVEDVRLPGAMSGVSPYAPITVRFLSEINLSEITQKIKVYAKATNDEIFGTWSSKMNNTNFHFVPTAKLEKDKVYKIVIAQDIQNTNGQALATEFVREFTVSYSEDTGGETNDLKIVAIEDTFSSQAKVNSPEGDALNMRVRYSQYNDFAFDGFIKFSIKNLQIEKIKNAKITLTTGTSLNDGAISVNLFKTTTDWQEATLNASSTPTYDVSPTDQILFKGDGSDTTVEFNITAALKNAITNGDEFISFALRNSPGNKENIYFNSREVENESLRPTIVVEETVLGLNNIENQKLDAYLDYKKKELIYKGIDSTDLNIYDISGKLIFSKNKLPHNSSISLSFLNSGIYFAVFTTEKIRYSLKLIL